jgi:CTP synthase (UTP-ammonia lyase)
MNTAVAIALVGEYTPSFLPHAKTVEVLGHMQTLLAQPIRGDWLSTAELAGAAEDRLASYDAVWIAPGSPYRNMQGALDAIRYARQCQMPLLGTCGGCQHVVIEYARNVLGFRDAAHAEYDPYASTLFITSLSCSLVGQTMDVDIEPNSRVAEIYGATRIGEQYYCNFGLNPDHQTRLHDGGLEICGRDANGEARILTIADHPFFLATLFVPQLTSTIDRPHPIIGAFMRAALAMKSPAAA